MERIKALAAFSAAALLGASMLSGCSDHNEGYPEITEAQVETTTEDIAELTTEAQKTTVKKNKKNKTTTTEADFDIETASENKSSKKTASNDDRIETTTTTALFGLDDGTYVEYHFRNKKTLNQHFEKHGGEFEGDFDYRTPEEYEKGASDVINNSEALYKTEAEDGDGVYYIESTNEFVILSTDGYIRTYFRPNGGKSYFDRQ